MRRTVAIENIEDIRRQQGIEDIELQEEIRTLRIGDWVKLTFVPETTSPGETLPVRITGIDGHAFRGKLVVGPASNGLSELRAGSRVAFTAAQIHSVPKAQSTHER